MKRWKLLPIAILSILFTAVPEIALMSARAQSSAPQQTESDAFKALQSDKDLDEFVTKYPNSALIPSAYRAYYLKNLRQRNYSQTFLYLDKLLALGERIDLGTRLGALIARAQAYTLGCRNEGLRTPDAYARARDAATDGQRVLGEWEKPPNMTDQQFDAQKKNVAALFDSMQEIAKGGPQRAPSRFLQGRAARSGQVRPHHDRNQSAGTPNSAGSLMTSPGRSNDPMTRAAFGY